MKKTGRYFLALLLSFCMLCGQLLPAVQAFAIPVATPSGEDGQHVWEIADESSGYPADFEHGTILRYKYDDGKGIASVTVSAYQKNPVAFTIAATRLVYNENVVKLVRANGSDAAAAQAPVSAKLPAALISQDGEDNGISTSTNLIGGGGPFKWMARTVATPSTIEGDGYKVFKLEIAGDEAVGESNDYYFNGFDGTRPSPELTLPDGTTEIDLYTINFKPLDGQTIDSDTFALDSDQTYPYGSCFKNSDNIKVSNNTLLVGFPKAPEKQYDVTITVKAGSIVMPNANIAITGTSAEGNPVSVDATTDASGVANVKLPANTVDYKMTVADTVVDGKTYTMKDSGLTFKVSQTSTTFQYNQMQEVQAAYPVRVKVFDKVGNDLDLTGATVKFGPLEITADQITGNTASFTTATSGDNIQLTVSGIQGFQNIKEGFPVNVRPNGSSKEEATISVGAVTAAATGSMATDETGDYVKVVMEKTVTNVTIPLPVPQVDGTNISVDQAKGMVLNFTPVEGSSEAVKAEVGANGITVSGDAITVTADTANTDLAASITAVAALPDGAYNMTIGGSGFDGAVLPVTVLTDYSVTPAKRIVNVGGNATLDETTGDITGITGGTTATVTDPTPGAGDDPVDNGNIDLTGKDENTDMVTGGSTTVDPGNGGVTPPATGDEGVTEVPKGDGLLETDVVDQMKPAIITDPIYHVVVDYKMGTSGEVTDMVATVYLQNAIAYSGAFGMYFDLDVFQNVTAANVELNSALGLKYNPAVHDGTNGPSNAAEINSDASKGDGYVFFGWMSGEAGATALDGTVTEQKIATITLPVKGEYQIKDKLLQVLDDRSIYTMDYRQTQYIKPNITGDAELDNQIVGSAWRILGTDGVSNCVKLADSAATRGGFYQIYYNSPDGTVTAGDEENTAYDIRMVFDIPEDITLSRADFWVTEPEHTGIANALIYIFDKPYDPKADPAMEVITKDKQPLKTNENGYAHVGFEPGGTYYYYVLADGHWSYPDGTPLTETDGLDYDTFDMTENGAVPTGKVVTGTSGRVPTAVVNGYVNPIMEATTYHKVSIEEAAGGTVNVAITSPLSAYNNMNYYFTVKPNAGYQWKDGETMTTIAASMKATVYAVDTADTTAPDAFRGESTGPFDIKWDEGTQRFYLEGVNITGDPYGDNEHGLDPLRAGDVVITIPDEKVDFASYEITATAGTGGKVEAKVDATITGGSTNINTDVAAQTGSIVETLTGGRTTSAQFTFTPDTNYSIKKVMVNGVEIKLTDEQKKSSFSYQFLNISSDQEIYVTFVDAAGNELSDPYISVTVGDKGTVQAYTNSDTALTPGSVSGPGSQSYVIEAPNDAFKATIVPDEGYEIDTVIVDGYTYTDTDKAPSKETDTTDGNDYFTGNLDVEFTGLAKGDTHSIVVTFKPKGEASIYAVVTATVVDGFGVLSPVGQTIYNIGSTPSYVMTPADGWTVNTDADSESIVLDGVDKSDKIVANADGKTFTYTLPALTGNVVLDAKFSEVGYEVRGKIQIAALVTDGTKVAPAKLVFTRKADATTQTDATTITITSNDVTAAGTGSSKLLSFAAKIPAGTWDVVVSKQGYLNYTITGFTVNEGATNIIYFGDKDSEGGTVAGADEKINVIPLTPGDAAGEGIAVAFNDSSMVVAGWLDQALAKNKVKGDINESNFSTGGGSNTDDMATVQTNMYKKRTTIKYLTDDLSDCFCD